MAFDTYLIDSLHKYIQANSTLLVLAATSLGHALIVRYVPLFGRTVAALALLNAVAMALIFAYDAVSIYVFGALAYLLTLLISRSTKNGSSKRWDLSIASLTLFVGWFLAQSIWRPSAPMTETPQSESAFRLVLDMLLLLRMVLFLWEYGAGRYEVPSIVEFFAWAGLPYSSQGTFLRFSDFHKQIKLGLKQHCPIGREWWIDLLSRIWLFVAGFLLTVLAKICESKGGIYKIVILSFTSPLGWYCIAAAQAGLMKLFGTLSGFDIPRNFHSPFVSRSLSEFWTRWNITATNAFRDMIFYNRWGLKFPNLYLNTILVFGVVGVWHGVNSYWILFGLLHGIGFCFYIFWRKRCAPRLPRVPAILSWAITYVFVCSCWALPPQIIKVANQVLSLG